MKAIDYADKNVVIAYENDTIATICNLMIRYNTDQVLIIRENKPIGIITKKDIATKLLQFVPPHKRRPVDKFLAERILNKNILVITPEVSMKSVAKKVLNNEIPIIVEDGKILGIVTKTSIVKAYVENFKGKFKVHEYINVDIPTVSPYHTLNKILEKILEKNCDRAVVIDKGKPLGVVSITDIALVFFDELPFPSKISKKEFSKMKYNKYNIPISETIVKEWLITVNEDEDLAAAGELMLKNNISSVLVTDSNYYKGMVTKDEVVKAFLRCFQ